MAYHFKVTLTIPEEMFKKYYGEHFNYKNPVAIERAPFIYPDKSSQVSYLRWIASRENVANNDRKHIEEVVNLFSELPFEISCIKCDDEKAENIALTYQKVARYYWDFRNYDNSDEKLDVMYVEFPFFCNQCTESVGENKIEFPINFDKPLNKRKNTYLHRRELLRDLKSMLYYGMKDGPKDVIDTREIKSLIEQQVNNKGRREAINIDNRKAKEIVNIMHF